MKSIFVYCLFFILPVLAQAQARDFEVWSDMAVTGHLNDKWQVGGDFGYRIVPVSGWQTAYIRPVVGYQPVEGWRLQVGGANFDTWQPESFELLEWRTYEYVNVYWPKLSWLHVDHRAGLDQRWFYGNGNNFQRFVHRFRYQISLRSHDFNLVLKRSPFYGALRFEVLRDINNRDLPVLFDHNRLIFAVGNHINESWRLEVQYMIIYLNEALQLFIPDIDVLRIRLFYKF